MAIPVTVLKGQIMGINGLTVTVVSTSAANGASEANNTSDMLSYNAGAGDPGIFLTKRNLSQTSWPQTDNCRAIKF